MMTASAIRSRWFGVLLTLLLTPTSNPFKRNKVEQLNKVMIAASTIDSRARQQGRGCVRTAMEGELCDTRAAWRYSYCCMLILGTR